MTRPPSSPASQQEPPRSLPGIPWAALIVVGTLLIATVLFVVSSLQSPELAWYAVSPVEPREAGDTLVGPVTYTVDGRTEGLTYFDFSRGSVIEGDPTALGWDLAFHRFTVLANGGEGFYGGGGILDLGEIALESVARVPTVGYEGNRTMPEPGNPAMTQWYDYSWTSHVLKPKPKVFAVRTADGRYAIFEILSYYCPAAQAGCITMRYVYQGAGGTSFERPRESA